MPNVQQLDTQGQSRDGKAWIRRLLEVSSVALLPANQDMQQVRGSACGRDYKARGVVQQEQGKCS